MDAIGILSIFVGLLALDLAAWRWGVDSTDGLNSPEWQRRGDWYARRRGGRGPGGMTSELWLWTEAEHRLRRIRQEAERDRLARRLGAPGRPLRATLASTLRALADRLDSSTPMVERRQRLAG